MSEIKNNVKEIKDLRFEYVREAWEAEKNPEKSKPGEGLIDGQPCDFFKFCELLGEGDKDFDLTTIFERDGKDVLIIGLPFFISLTDQNYLEFIFNTEGKLLKLDLLEKKQEGKPKRKGEIIPTSDYPGYRGLEHEKLSDYNIEIAKEREKYWAERGSTA